MNFYLVKDKQTNEFGGAFRLAFYLCTLLFLSACLSAKHPPSSNQMLVNQFQAEGLVAKEIDRGVLVYLPSVMFDFGGARISSDAVDKVEFIAKVSNERANKKRGIQVEGHTDSIGSESSNMALSKARAESVSTFLFEHGVENERIGVAWFGESRPMVPNQLIDGSDSPQGRTANRRVEFILLNP